VVGQGCKVEAGCLKIVVKKPLSMEIIRYLPPEGHRYISAEKGKDRINPVLESVNIDEGPRSYSCRISVKFSWGIKATAVVGLNWHLKSFILD